MRYLLASAIAASLNAVAADAPDYSLTVYSSARPGQVNTESLANYGGNFPGFALVRDSRKMTLQAGAGVLRFTDVAKRIDPTTVAFESVTDPAGTRVLEQNYQFDLVNREKLLERYVGQAITVEQERGDTVERLSGTLLSAADGTLILQRDTGEVVSIGAYTNVLFPSLPGGLITRPTLVWLVNAKQAGTHDTRVSYRTGGMTWWSDYNVTLREQGDNCTMDLSAWVTIVNQSGASYPAAQLKLVAGDVNLAPGPQAPAAPRKMVMMDLAAAGAEADGFQESQLFEYHLYTLGRRSDLPDNSTKQLELFPSVSNAACRKQLVFTAAPQPWAFWSSPITDQGYGATTSGTVGAYLEFKNDEANRMGMPLPAGRLRVNQASVDGNLEFVGEDVIKHTPRNETLRVKLGNAFDIVGERKQMSFNVDSGAKHIDESFEISVRNRKKTPVKVVVREYLYRWSRWEVTSRSHEFAKRDAATIDFPLDIPADGEVTVKYGVRYSW
ncbi:DUF4139 domain-containing protein [Tahibacter amnicola]|uniref:DUF4139 domain-containing protein n=1 Tax=Tahibacter amnicola TaxID=2976241 RepID=A0ABY6BFS5_9GAMM|nr:hypothetical protein [Tahibacter amnicola]UXI68619.1 hypothetical protein N4264_02920 [Tahibacter amnicola]